MFLSCLLVIYMVKFLNFSIFTTSGSWTPSPLYLYIVKIDFHQILTAFDRDELVDWLCKPFQAPGAHVADYSKPPTWHGPDFTCNFPQTVLRPIETTQSQIYPKPFICFDSHLLVNISRCSSQHLSVISSKHCLCLLLELRPTGTAVRLKNPNYLGLKTQTLPDHSLKNVRWAVKTGEENLVVWYIC